MKNLFFVLFLFFIFPTEARIFDMGKSKFGSYLRSTYSPWASPESPFGQSSGSGVGWNESFTNLMSYEFGILYNSSQITWRFGLEVISPPSLSGVTGKGTANGTLYYRMDSTLSAVNPKVGIEVNLKTWPKSRLWMYFDYGLANLTMGNTYRFTAAGTAQFPVPGADFREEIKANSGNYTGSFGFESLLSDNTTWCLELGYRMMQFSGLNHNVAATTFQGPVSIGTGATTNSGGARSLDMSGAFASFALRIWVY